jgi:hypothetical protein
VSISGPVPENPGTHSDLSLNGRKDIPKHQCVRKRTKTICQMGSRSLETELSRTRILTPLFCINLFLVKGEDKRREWFFSFLRLVIVFNIDLEITQ